jgi:DNA-binding response OmpR family regulator
MCTTGAKVLVVDDEPTILDLLYEYLSETGYECVKATTGEEALKSLSQDRYDVMLLDLKLPGITGIDVIKKVKSIYPGTAVIVVTGTGDIQTVVEAIKVGAVDCIIKPFKIEEVNKNIHRVLENSADSDNSQGVPTDGAGMKRGKTEWMARLDNIARGVAIRLELETGQAAKMIERTAAIAFEMDIPESYITRWAEEKKRMNTEEMEFASSLMSRLRENPLAQVFLNITDLSEDNPEKYNLN